jgi:hypothetical protein
MKVEVQKFSSLASLIQKNGVKTENAFVENPKMVSYRLSNVKLEQITEFKSIAKSNSNEFELYVNVHTKSNSKKTLVDEFLDSNSCRIIFSQDGDGIDLINNTLILYKKLN